MRFLAFPLLTWDSSAAAQTVTEGDTLKQGGFRGHHRPTAGGECLAPFARQEGGRGITRCPRKALGLFMPLAPCAERERLSKLVDDRPATAGVHLTMSTMAPAYRVGDVVLIRPSETVEAGSDYMLRRPFFFKRRKNSKVKGLRLMAFKLSLPMTAHLFRTAVPTLKL